ncbi:hypothetical protein U1Q18_031851, partial [Sarracenia purpurea var. burkii]
AMGGAYLGERSQSSTEFTSHFLLIPMRIRGGFPVSLRHEEFRDYHGSVPLALSAPRVAA